MGIHSCSIWRCSNALYTSNMDMRCRVALNLPNFGPNLHRHICVRVHSHACQKHIQALKHFIYIQYRCEMQCGLVFIPQNMIPWCHSGSPLPPIFPIGSPPPQWCNCVVVHPYAHPQHVKVQKHLIYIQDRCEMQSGVVYSVKTWPNTKSWAHPPSQFYKKFHPSPVKA